MRQNIRSLALVAGCCTCLMAWPNTGRSQNWYLNAEAGVSVADKVDLKHFFGPTPGVKLDFDPGPSFGVAGGYNFNDFIGAEFQTGFTYNSVKSASDGLPWEGGLSHVPFVVNAVFRYDQPNCNFVPYIGAGAGGDMSLITLDGVVRNGVFTDGTDATVAFAWQAFGGVRYKFNQTMSIGAGYKYYSVNSATWDFAGFTDSVKVGRARTHLFLVEFNMKF